MEASGVTAVSVFSEVSASKDTTFSFSSVSTDAEPETVSPVSAHFTTAAVPDVVLTDPLLNSADL